MLRKFLLLKDDVVISKRKFIAATLLVSCTLAWFLLFQAYSYSIIDYISAGHNLLYISLISFYGFGALSVVIGSIVIKRVSRKRILAFWILLGTFSTVLMLLFQGFWFSLIISILLGFSLGLGFPTMQSALAINTGIFERARISGLIIFITLIILVFSLMTISLFELSLQNTIIFLASLRFVSILALFLDSFEIKIEKSQPWMTVFSKSKFYIVPWIMFNIAAGLRAWWELPTTLDFSAYSLIANLLFLVFASISAIISGYLADYFGRKYPIVIGMVSMGVSFTLLGYFMDPPILLAYGILSGCSWGFLLTLYLAIPGDLSDDLISMKYSKERYYAIGTGIPFILFLLFQSLPEIFTLRISPSSLAPALSIIIFLSILPILIAKDTLSKEELNKRRMPDHAAEIKKFVKEVEDSS